MDYIFMTEPICFQNAIPIEGCYKHKDVTMNCVCIHELKTMVYMHMVNQNHMTRLEYGIPKLTKMTWMNITMSAIYQAIRRISTYILMII